MFCAFRKPDANRQQALPIAGTIMLLFLCLNRSTYHTYFVLFLDHFAYLIVKE